MANDKNLKKPSPTEARENGRKGGIASGMARRARKTFREELLYLLDTEKDVNGKKRTIREIVSIGIIEKAAKGDPKAFKVIRDTIGEAVVAKMEISGIPAYQPKELSLEELAAFRNTIEKQY